jgi:hypothetical protein
MQIPSFSSLLFVFSGLLVAPVDLPKQTKSTTSKLARGDEI